MSPHSADRNLLFGIIALQMDFISRDQLIAGMGAWILDKRKPLGQVLSEQRALSPDDHEAIESLVRRHLLRHDNDAERSLAALSAIGQRLRDELSRIGDPDLQASLPGIAAARGDMDSTLTYVGSPTTPGGRFRILRPHAQGGLGVVSVALDEELHREVALKEIQERYASDEQPRLRFLLEAEITGGLEHPGIVPVYGLGHHPDGRPFYAMRFVRGESLKEAIEAFHHGPDTRSPSPQRGEGARRAGEGVGANLGQTRPLTPDPSPPRGEANRRVVASPLALRRLLSRFLDVCNAIAYAHSRGVLHRDIKPGNVLLGPYGETLVVDWGLAKIVGRDDPATTDLSAEPTLRPPSASGTGETVSGTAMGTPAYMSPEQAEGRLDLLGPQSDVYSLGATLYVVLTGRAPFDGIDAAEVLPKVQRGEFTRPRVVNASIPKPLEAICVKAMALKPADRYATPRALAEDIEHWLADEPVSAYREPWPDRARRWSRRHRTLVTSATAVLLLGLLGSLGFAAVVTAKNRELARQTQRAEAREQMAVDAVKRFRDVVVEEPVLKNNPALEDLRKRLLKEPLAFFQSLRGQLQADNQTNRRALARLADAAHDYAHLTEEIGDIQDGLRSHVESLAIWEKLVRDDPAKSEYWWGLAAIENCRGNMLRAAGHPHQAMQSYGRALAIRERLARTNPSVAEFRNHLAESHRGIGLLQGETGHPDQAMESYGKAQAIWERLARENPGVADFQSRLANNHNSIGALQGQTGHPEQALDSFGKALAIQERLTRENPTGTSFLRDLAASHDNIGLLQSQTGHADRALESHGKALEIFERLARENPSVAALQSVLAASHNSIGGLQSGTGHPDHALESYAKALAILERLAREHPSVTAFQSDLAQTHHYIGTLQRETGHTEQALESYGKALAIRERLARENPSIVQFQRYLAATSGNIGVIQSETGHPEQALEAYGKALAIFERLARENPSVTAFQRNRSLSHLNIGNIQSHTGHPGHALDSYGQALAILERLVRENPSVTEFQSHLAASQISVGSIQHETGHPERALGSYGKGLAILERLARENPSATEFQHRLASSHNHIGRLRDETGDPNRALESYGKALAIQERLARENPTVTELQRGLAASHNNIGVLLSTTGHPDQALQSYAKALAIQERLAREDPSVTASQGDLARSHGNIGNLHSKTGHPEQALESYGKALGIQERRARENPSVTDFQISLAGSYNNIGNLQKNTGHPDQALESHGRALAIRERLARENPSVTEFQSSLAASHDNIGLLQSETGHPDPALESYGKALAIRERLARENPSFTGFQSNLAESHYNIGNLQYQTGHLEQALDSYGKALAIQVRLAREHPESPGEASNLGVLLNKMAMIELDAKHFDQARGRLQQAISLQKKGLTPNPRNPTYRQNLGDYLRNLIKAAKALGKDDEANAAQRELAELAANDPAKAALDQRLAAAIRGQAPKDNRERLQLAYRAYEKQLYAVSTQVFGEALDADPRLADDRRAQHRYNAACAAALAAASGTGPPDRKETSGRTEKPLTDAERAKLRNQARTWLEAELATWTKLLASANAQQRQAIAETLKHWQQDTDLAGVRDEAELAKLPEVERKAWKSLWAKVETLLAKARTP
jgi:serine/threonine-protein kinase